MTEQHPITPPPELIQKWWEGDNGALDEFDEVVKQAAHWGADMELEACCNAIHKHESGPLCDGTAIWLRTVRRPKPRSLAEEGYDALDTYIYGNPDPGDKERTYNTLRCALKRLQELEGQGDG